MGTKNFVIVEENEILRLLKNNFKFEALECGGVDNWTWYSHALKNCLSSDFKGSLEDGYEDLARTFLNDKYNLISLDLNCDNEKSE